MFVIGLPNGNLLVPESAVSDGNGAVLGDAYVEEGDEPLRREFLDFLARHGRGAGEGRGPA